MKLMKLSFAACALLAFAVACNNTQTTQNTNAGASPKASPAAGASTPAPAATPDELAAAAGDYAKFCTNCHKADGAGGPWKDEETGKTVKVPSLRDHGLKDPDSELAKQIAEGGDEMPPFKSRLDQQRIDNLVRYIRREFHGRTTTAAATPAQPSH